MANKANPKTTKHSTDVNLALISVILVAAALFNSIFTGIPAIILGIMALKKKSGDPTQAKVGIILGVIGCLLLIPIIWIAVYFLRAPFNEQFSVTQQDKTQLVAITTALNEYKKKHGAFPSCNSVQKDQTCKDWAGFTNENPGLVKYPVEFEAESYTIEDRPAGTIVYAMNTTCFVNTPTDPRYLDDNKNVPPKNIANYAAVIFFHSKGRSCFPTNTQ